jgi:threonine aldolase
MREAMARAEVGDDVFSEDPTVLALEEATAALIGKEAALFVTSGTMGNQLAIALHTRPGDEVIVGEGAHVVCYESGAGPALSGVQFAVAGSGGTFTADEMEEAIQPKVYWSPRTSLVCIENTHNRSGGRIFPLHHVDAIATRATNAGLALHLDGARLWNASAALSTEPCDLAAPFDTVSVCFSKGLGAPVGSALCGTRQAIERARRLRKMWGGGMRQAGILAAGALHALRHHRARLVEDHAAARDFATHTASVQYAYVDVARVETNIINVDLDAGLTATSVATEARKLGLLINATGPRRLRAVIHMDVSHAEVLEGARLLARAISTVAKS